MTFGLVLLITFALSTAFANGIRKAPLLFYALACVLVIISAAGAYGLFSGVWWKPLHLLIRKCFLALSLFTVVMFIGVLPKDSKLGARMRAARAELSITACILCLGHVCTYLVHYSAIVVSGTIRVNVMASFVVAIALFILLVVLGVTSFGFVKRKMRTKTWKKMQILAYPFFLLTYAHLMIMLAPSALSGRTSAIVSVGIYSAVFVSYLVLRLWRYHSGNTCASASQ